MAFSGPGGAVMNRRNRALLRALAPLALMGVIFWFSAQPAGGHHFWWVVVGRKLGHITGYAMLTALWAWALQGFVRRPVLVAVCIALAYACTDEFHQTFVRGRVGTPIDVGVDAIGMAIAATLIHTRRPSLKRRGKVDARGRVPKSSLARSP
jgi:VanZ family protein